MERRPNRNGFTWKKMKQTACTTAQYKSVTMMDFKVKEGAENMFITSTVGSFILMKSPVRKKSQINSRNVPMVKPIQDKQPSAQSMP